MATLIKNARVLDCSANIDVKSDVLISRDRIDIGPMKVPDRCLVIDGRNLLLTPGLIDLHVHFREPGFTYKEDIASGIQAALAGGITSALVMPNTMPSIDRYKHVRFQLNRAKKIGFDLMVAASASVDLLGKTATDVANLKRAGAKALTDDGRPILTVSLMEEILRLCRAHDLVCMQHAEDLRISLGASLGEGKVSRKVGIPGQPSSAESSLVERDIALASKIGARYHVLHLSCRESLLLVRAAKRRKALVTCEVSPHHLLLRDFDAIGLDTCKKMNPPLRGDEDVRALIEGLQDGTIDAVASDHAPHSRREKAKPFEKAPFGVVGVESAILVLMTLVNNGILPLNRAIGLMTTGPARILGEASRIGTFVGELALKNAVLINPNHRGNFSVRNLFGRSKNSPFLGMELFGKVMATFQNGELVFWQNN